MTQEEIAALRERVRLEVAEAARMAERVELQFARQAGRWPELREGNRFEAILEAAAAARDAQRQRRALLSVMAAERARARRAARTALLLWPAEAAPKFKDGSPR